jgi:transposase
MALGRRKQNVQQELMVPTSALQRSPGHPFYVALNKLLGEAKFDAYVEGLCEPLYREGGRPSIPPGVFFRLVKSGKQHWCWPVAAPRQ